MHLSFRFLIFYITLLKTKCCLISETSSFQHISTCYILYHGLLTQSIDKVYISGWFGCGGVRERVSSHKSFATIQNIIMMSALGEWNLSGSAPPPPTTKLWISKKWHVTMKDFEELYNKSELEKLNIGLRTFEIWWKDCKWN